MTPSGIRCEWYVCMYVYIYVCLYYACYIHVNLPLESLYLFKKTKEVIKNVLSQAPPCFQRHIKPLVLAAFAVVSTHQFTLGPVAYGPLCLYVIFMAYASAVGI
jgi:hypothetical protein